MTKKTKTPNKLTVREILDKANVVLGKTDETFENTGVITNEALHKADTLRPRPIETDKQKKVDNHTIVNKNTNDGQPELNHKRNKDKE